MLSVGKGFRSFILLPIPGLWEVLTRSISVQCQGTEKSTRDVRPPLQQCVLQGKRSQQQLLGPSTWLSAKGLRPGPLAYWVCWGGYPGKVWTLSSKQRGPASPLGDDMVLLIYAESTFSGDGQVNVRRRLRNFLSMPSPSSGSRLPWG